MPSGVIRVALLLLCLAVIPAAVCYRNWTYLEIDRVSPVRCSETSVDFGRVGIGETPSHRFVFHNVSQGTVRIRQVKADCGCVLHRVDRQACAAGQEANLEISLRTARLSAPAVFERSVLVFFEGTDTHPVHLQLKATLVPDIELDEPAVVVSAPGPQRLRQATLRVRRGILTASEFAALRITADGWRVSETHRDEDAVAFQLQIPASELPTYPRPIELHYTKRNEARSQLVVVEQGKAVAQVNLEPRYYAAHVAPGTAAERLPEQTTQTFRLAGPTAAESQIESVEVRGLNSVDWQWQFTSADRREFRLWISGLEATPPTARGEIVVAYRDVANKTGHSATANAYVMTN